MVTDNMVEAFVRTLEWTGGEVRSEREGVYSFLCGELNVWLTPNGLVWDVSATVIPAASFNRDASSIKKRMKAARDRYSRFTASCIQHVEDAERCYRDRLAENMADEDDV